jgi:hypothetical protein
MGDRSWGGSRCQTQVAATPEILKTDYAYTVEIPIPTATSVGCEATDIIVGPNLAKKYGSA